MRPAAPFISPAPPIRAATAWRRDTRDRADDLDPPLFGRTPPRRAAGEARAPRPGHGPPPAAPARALRAGRHDSGAEPAPSGPGSRSLAGSGGGRSGPPAPARPADQGAAP